MLSLTCIICPLYQNVENTTDGFNHFRETAAGSGMHPRVFVIEFIRVLNPSAVSECSTVAHK